MLIKLAKTAQEFNEVYHIRYQCLSLELGDETYANHLAQTYHDEDDEKCQRVFVAYEAGKALGTARLLLRREQLFIADDFYDFGYLADMFGLPISDLLNKTCLIDRVCISKEYRGHHIFTRFFEAICIEMKKCNCHILLAAIEQNNRKSESVFTHFGFQKINELKVVGNWAGYLYYFELSNNGNECG
jgi:GNAT superfamily N-acetyltransferase